MTLGFLVGLLWLRLASIIFFTPFFTWWIAGNDNWFQDPLPGRGTVFLVAALLGLTALACTGLIRLGMTSLSRDEQARLRKHDLFWDED